MAVHQQIKWATVDQLLLDPRNPRLGRKFVDSNPSQSVILKKLSAWTLDELATSFLESGFWIQEALIAVEEDSTIYVIEGNRRLATIKLLKLAFDGDSAAPSRFQALVGQFPSPADLFDRIPYILADSRADVSAYLGFRHVTGIKEWRPAEKAEFIAQLIDDEKLSYDQVRRRIGSKAPAVRQNYIAYKLLHQVEDASTNLDQEQVEERFGVLYRALNTTGVQKYLGVDLRAEPAQAQTPVPPKCLPNLARFTTWVFGTRDRPALFTDSRQIDRFASLLENEKARAYLEDTSNPNYQVALEIGSDDTADLLQLLKDASYSVRVALSTVHRHRGDEQVRGAVETLVVDALALSRQFPSALEIAKKEVC